MHKEHIKWAAVLALFMSVTAGCGEQAQKAAENANRDTVPAITTRPDTLDSINTDSTVQQ